MLPGSFLARMEAKWKPNYNQKHENDTNWNHKIHWDIAGKQKYTFIHRISQRCLPRSIEITVISVLLYVTTFIMFLSSSVSSCCYYYYSSSSFIIIIIVTPPLLLLFLLLLLLTIIIIPPPFSYYYYYYYYSSFC